MRSGHGGSRDGFGLPVIPSGSDVQTGSENINGGAIIGELSPCVLDGRSGNSDRFSNASGRGVLRILVIVSGGYDDGNTTVIKLKTESFVSGVAIVFHPPGAYRFNSPVNTGRSTAPQAHRSNRGYPSPCCLFGDPVHAGDTVVRWRGLVTVSGMNEGKKAHMSDHEPLPSSPRTFTAMTWEALATPYG